MATETTVRLVDDIDGGPATETVEFGIDGRHYTIDLNDVHAKGLRDSITPFVEAARRLPASPAGKAPRGQRKPGVGREQNQAIRSWARQQGITVGERGRIPIDVQLRFDAAHGQA